MRLGYRTDKRNDYYVERLTPVITNKVYQGKIISCLNKLIN